MTIFFVLLSGYKFVGNFTNVTVKYYFRNSPSYALLLSRKVCLRQTADPETFRCVR